MNLAEMNSARIPGPGDFGPPEYHDDMEPTWEEEIQMEADAILAECETTVGIIQFVDAWADSDCHVSATLVGLFAAIVKAKDDKSFTREMVMRSMNREALRQAAERHPKPMEDRPC